MYGIRTGVDCDLNQRGDSESDVGHQTKNDKSSNKGSKCVRSPNLIFNLNVTDTFSGATAGVFTACIEVLHSAARWGNERRYRRLGYPDGSKALVISTYQFNNVYFNYNTDSVVQ